MRIWRAVKIKFTYHIKKLPSNTLPIHRNSRCLESFCILNYVKMVNG